jgi:hypothetical protein
MDEEKYISWRGHIGLLGYRLIKKYSTTLCQRTCSSRALNSEYSHSHGQKIHGVRKYKTDFFTDLVMYDAESGLQSSQSIYYTRQTSKPLTRMKRLSLDVLKSNIQQVLANFNQKEIYIIEHLLGSMGESCYLQKR